MTGDNPWIQNERAVKKAPWIRLAVRFLCCTLGLALLFGILGGLWYLFAPFVLAFGFAMVVNPEITRLEEKLAWKRPVLVLWVLGFFVLVVVSFLWVILPIIWREFWELLGKWEVYLPEMMSYLGELEENLAEYIPLDSRSWVAELAVWVADFIAFALDKVSVFVQQLPHFFIASCVFALSSYFFACDLPRYQRYWKGKVDPDALWLAGRVKYTVVTAFGGYLKTQFILSFGVFVILTIGFYLMNQNFALLFAFFIAVLDFVPLIGAGLILLPWTILSFVMGETGKALILFILWGGTALFRRMLEPKILGQQTGLSPILSLASMYVGLQLAGVWGLIFAPVLLLVVLHFFGVSVFQGLLRDLNTAGLDVLTLFEAGQEES